MATKPTIQLDWINDDSPTKYTIPDGAAQLTGHISGTNADPKIFNWCWWRVSQWLEYLDELILDQIPEGTTYGKVKLDDLTTGRVDIDKLDQSGKTHGLIYQAGITSGKVNLTGAAGITGTLPIGNHDSRVGNGLNSSGSVILPIRSGLVVGTPSVTSEVVFNQNGIAAYNSGGTDFCAIAEGGQVRIGRSGNNRIDYSDGSQVLNIVGGILSTGCQVPATTIQAGTMTGVTVQSASSGARSVLSNYLSIYEDRGDTIIAHMYRQFNDNYVVDLGAELTNPTQLTWGGIRVNAGDTAGLFFNWATTGTSVSIGGKGDRLLRLQSVSDEADYGIDFLGSFDKGFMRVVPESGTTPTHSANQGTFWVDTNADLYINDNGSTSWDKFLKESDAGDAILGDGTAGRNIRAISVSIQDGTNPNTIKVNTINRWNGDVISTVDNISKGSTVGDFYLGATGVLLRILNSGLTGSFLGGLGAIGSTSYTTFVSADPIYNAAGMDIYFDTPGSGAVDITSIVDTGDFSVNIIYFTTA